MKLEMRDGNPEALLSELYRTFNRAYGVSDEGRREIDTAVCREVIGQAEPETDKSLYKKKIRYCKKRLKYKRNTPSAFRFKTALRTHDTAPKHI